MNINFNEMDIKILNFLSFGGIYSLQEILNEFSFSESLIKKSLSKLDNSFKEHNLSTLRIGRGFYSIKSSQIKSVKSLIKANLKYSKEERITYILFFIITKGTVNLSKLAHEFDYNRKTLQLDLKVCKQILEVFNLSVQSCSGKHITFKGDIKYAYIFLIALIVKIILKKQIPAYEKIYKILFPKDKLKKYNNYFQQISIISPITMGFKRYCGIISIFTIYDNFPKLIPINYLSNSFSKKEDKIIKKYIYKLSLLNINLINNNQVILSHLLSEMDFIFYENPLRINSPTKKFISKFEQFYYPLTPKNRMILHTIIKDSIFEKAFDLLENADIHSYFYIEEKDDFNISIKNILKNCKIDISYRGYLKIVMFLNSLEKKDNLKSLPPENILILDTSLDFWMGNIIKSHLYRNYNLKKIDLKHFLENIKYETYDLVFTLDLPRDRYPKVNATLIPIDWIEFGVNKDYFNRFPFKHL